MKKNIPTVLINGSIENTDIPFVRINELKAGYLATRHMIEKGLRKIAFLGGPENSIPTTDKLKGYKKAFKEFYFRPGYILKRFIRGLKTGDLFYDIKYLFMSKW